MSRILYVSPWAHRTGHYSYATSIECSMLSSIAKVNIVCYDDAVVNVPIGVRILKVKRPKLLKFVGKIQNWLSMFLEDLYLLILISIWSLRERYDVVHVRDADPFPFVAFIAALLSRNKNWAMSYVSTWSARSPTFSRFISSRVWKPLYSIAIRRKNIVVHCQNEDLLRFLGTSFCGGALSRRSILIPVFVPNEREQLTTKIEARRALNLPLEGFIFLSIGAVHRGKLFGPIIEAASGHERWWIVHKGALMEHVDLTAKGRRNLILRLEPFTQTEEALYYIASDAVILSYRADFVETASTLWRAVYYRLPVLASDSISIGNLVRRYNLGLLFEPGNFGDLRRAIEEFISMPEEQRDIFIDGMKKFAQVFSQGSTQKLWLEIYHRVFLLS